MMEKKIFHGRCLLCTMQEEKGLKYCVGCKYKEEDWTLPDKGDKSEYRLYRIERFLRILAFCILTLVFFIHDGAYILLIFSLLCWLGNIEKLTNVHCDYPMILINSVGIGLSIIYLFT